MGIEQEAKLVVKHTFLEFVDLEESVPSKPSRARCYTDSELVVTPSASELPTPLESSESSDAVSMQELSEEAHEDQCVVKDGISGGTDLSSPSTSPWHGPVEWVPTEDMLASACQFQMLPMVDENGFESMALCDQGAYVWWQMPAEMVGQFSYAMPMDIHQQSLPVHEELQQQHQPEMQELAHIENDFYCQQQQQQQQPEEEQDEKTRFTKLVDAAFTKASAAANGKSARGPCTTVMLRNLPSEYSREMVLELIDSEAFAGRYDFLYLPVDFNSGVSLGYAFVDLISPADADQFVEHFTGFARWPVPSDKVCTVSWSNQHQGLDQHVERYRNSPVMHETVPEEWKPMIFSNGQVVPFPAPTKQIKAPKIRCRPDGALGRGSRISHA